MKTKKINKKNIKELNIELLNLVYKQFKLRIQTTTNDQLRKTHLFKIIRRDIARIKTILNNRYEK